MEGSVSQWCGPGPGAELRGRVCRGKSSRAPEGQSRAQTAAHSPFPAGRMMRPGVYTWSLLNGKCPLLNSGTVMDGDFNEWVFQGPIYVISYESQMYLRLKTMNRLEITRVKAVMKT